MAHLNVVLHEPEIPANTGNIGRTCVATGTRLHLIEPLGFRLDEKSLKRAGMDYWNRLDVSTYIDYQDFLEKNPGAKIYYCLLYTSVSGRNGKARGISGGWRRSQGLPGEMERGWFGVTRTGNRWIWTNCRFRTRAQRT